MNNLHNDKDLTAKIIEIVSGDAVINAFITQIEQLIIEKDEMRDEWDKGYNWGLRDALTILKGENK